MHAVYTWVNLCGLEAQLLPADAACQMTEMDLSELNWWAFESVGYN
jgi:hypothetical protein